MIGFGKDLLPVFLVVSLHDGEKASQVSASFKGTSPDGLGPHPPQQLT